MAFAFKCDICGKYFDETSESTQGIKGNMIKIGHVPSDARIRPDVLEEYHACPDCIAATMALIKVLKTAGEEKEPAPEEGNQNNELES